MLSLEPLHMDVPGVQASGVGDGEASGLEGWQASGAEGGEASG